MYFCAIKVKYTTIMDDIYMLPDPIILERIGSHLKQNRLKQNITQQSLAEAAGVSLSSVKNIEKGEIRSFDALLRVLRTLGKLDVLQPLVDEEQMSPSEYYEFVHSLGKHQRKRAAGRLNHKKNEEKSV
jgi:transcriptional regulator with XRE-family HTH domain